MTTRSFPWTGCTPARTFISSTVAALSLALCGCGINVAPPSADSGTNSTGEGDTSVASTNSQHSGPPGGYSASPGNNSSPPGNSSTTAANPHGAMDPAMTGADDPDTAGDAAMHGADPALDAAADPAMHGADPALDAADPALAAANPLPGAMHGAGDAAVDAGAGEAVGMEARRGQFEAQDPAAAGGAAFNAAGAGQGAPEGSASGGRSGRASQFEEGSAPYVVMLMVEAIDAGDLETAAKYISDKADGVLGSVRDGDAGENQLRELQSYFATMDPLSQRPRTRSITLNFNGGQNKVLSFVVVREGREFLVESMTVHDAQGRGR